MISFGLMDNGIVHWPNHNSYWLLIHDHPNTAIQKAHHQKA